MNKKTAFSLVEVLFAVAFLTMVGVAMMALNATAIRITEVAELKIMATGLVTEAVQSAALERKASAVWDLPASCKTTGCYVLCAADTAKCTFTANRQTTRLGSGKVQFETKLTSRVADVSGHIIVTGTTNWGSGLNRQVTASKYLE